MYGWREVSKHCNCSKSYAYVLIKKLQVLLKKDFPDVIIIPGKIPKQFFERLVLGIDSNNNSKSN